MARKVFFSFHFQRDSWRASQVRNCWVTKGTANSFMDAANWERVKRSGDKAVKNWINSQLTGTSVTIVLIGTETANRKYVNYEIEQSYKRGNALIGIYIHDLKNQFGQSEWWPGRNPFSNFKLTSSNFFVNTLANIVPTYNWVNDNGYRNISYWIERAIADASRRKVIV